MAEKLKQSSVQIYDKKQNFPKNITQQNITSKLNLTEFSIYISK